MSSEYPLTLGSRRVFFDRAVMAREDFLEAEHEFPDELAMHPFTLGALASEWGAVDGLTSTGNLLFNIPIVLDEEIQSGTIIGRCRR